MTDNAKPQSTSTRLDSLCTPHNIASCRIALDNEDTAALYLDALRIIPSKARRMAGTISGTSAEDVAQVASIVAGDLVLSGRYDTASRVASVATRSAAVAALQDKGRTREAVDLDADDPERTGYDHDDHPGEKQARLSLPKQSSPAALYRITGEDVTAATVRLTHRGAEAAALAVTPWKAACRGDGTPAVPAAAVRRAAGLPALSGRNAKPYAEDLAAEAPALLADLKATGARVLAWSQYRGQRQTWTPEDADTADATSAAVRTHQQDAPRMERRRAEGPAHRVTTERLDYPTAVVRAEGPAVLVTVLDAAAYPVDRFRHGNTPHTAGAAVTYRTDERHPQVRVRAEGPPRLTMAHADALPYVWQSTGTGAQWTDRTTADPMHRDSTSRGSTTKSGPASLVTAYRLVSGYPISTQTGDLLSLDERHAVRIHRPLDPSTEGTKDESQEFDPMATDPRERSAAPAPGVTPGVPTGAAGTGAGEGKPFRVQTPRKSKRSGAVGGPMTQA